MTRCIGRRDLSEKYFSERDKRIFKMLQFNGLTIGHSRIRFVNGVLFSKNSLRVYSNLKNI